MAHVCPQAKFVHVWVCLRRRQAASPFGGRRAAAIVVGGFEGHRLAKQRKAERISEDLGACVVHSDDVAAIAAILKDAAGPNDRLRVSVPGFSLDEAADLASESIRTR